MHALSEELGLALAHAEIAAKVQKIGGGTPSQQSIAHWRLVFDTDPDWYPGKVLQHQKQPGRPKVITPHQEQAIARCAMSLKAKGLEPTAQLVK